MCNVMYTGTYEIGALFSSWMKAWQDVKNRLVEPLTAGSVIVASDDHRSSGKRNEKRMRWRDEAPGRAGPIFSSMRERASSQRLQANNSRACCT